MQKGESMTSRLQQQLPAMFSLAHDRSESARIELAGKLADIFLTEGACLSLREEELANELIDQLLRTQSPALRAQLVQKFSDVANMPRKVAMNLACDNIDIAGKILTTSQTLTDEDLVVVIESQSGDHAYAVAQRKSIGEAVADALVTTGDLKVMQLVAENLGVQLSRKAVDVLTDTARFTAGLREPVMRRPEMTAEAAARLYWWVSQDLRRYALKRFGIALGQIDKALAKTIEELLSYHQLEKTNDTIMYQIADWLTERQAVSTQILPQVLRLGYFRLFNMLLARLTDLDIVLIDAIMNEAGGRQLAATCRALGIDKPGFVSIFLLSRGARVGEQIVHPHELSNALIAFDRLSIPLAQDLLHSWKQDPAYLLKSRDEGGLEFNAVRH
jgi:uncharacterized protein (DUF2336 family)